MSRRLVRILVHYGNYGNYDTHGSHLPGQHRIATHLDVLVHAGTRCPTLQLELSTVGQHLSPRAPVTSFFQYIRGAQWIAPHRRFYLSYAGAVSGQRGRVRELFHGFVSLDADKLLVDVSTYATRLNARDRYQERCQESHQQSHQECCVMLHTDGLARGRSNYTLRPALNNNS